MYLIYDGFFSRNEFQNVVLHNEQVLKSEDGFCLLMICE